MSAAQKMPDPGRGSPLSVVLVEPEIPPNTGNVVRTCAATGCDLHLVEPFGFIFGDRLTQRAGLDYWEQVRLTIHEDLDAFLAAHPERRLWLFSARAEQHYHEVEYRQGDMLVFGRETKGLPAEFTSAHPERLLKLPMAPWARSLNLSNSVGIALYEALRQTGFNFPERPPEQSLK